MVDGLHTTEAWRRHLEPRCGACPMPRGTCFPAECQAHAADRLRAALRKASDELYGAAAGLDDPDAQAMVERWAREARQAADQ